MDEMGCGGSGRWGGVIIEAFKLRQILISVVVLWKNNNPSNKRTRKDQLNIYYAR